MLSEFQIHETYRVFGLEVMHSANGKYKVNWALRLIESGLESEDLFCLAGFSMPLNQFEIDDYFNRALQGLSIKRPADHDALWGYAKLLSIDMMNGRLSPLKGVSLIYEINVLLDYPEQLSEYTELNDEWYCECIHGWSSQERYQRIVKASQDLVDLIEYPSII